MSNTSNERYVGTFLIDLTHLSGLLYDIARGAMRGLRRERPGLVEVIAELATQFPAVGAAAGISPNAYARFAQATEHLAKIRAERGAVDKLAEVLKESEALYENERENAISQMADAVRSTAKREKNPGLSAPFEKLLRYNSQTADKAVKTRRKKTAANTSEPEGTG
jgi:hypothetical protein